MIKTQKATEIHFSMASFQNDLLVWQDCYLLLSIIGNLTQLTIPTFSQLRYWNWQASSQLEIQYHDTRLPSTFKVISCHSSDYKTLLTGWHAISSCPTIPTSKLRSLPMWCKFLALLPQSVIKDFAWLKFISIINH